MRVIVDSNAIINHDWFLDGPYAQVLVEAGSRGDLEILIPEVVITEVMRPTDATLRKQFLTSELRMLASSHYWDRRLPS